MRRAMGSSCSPSPGRGASPARRRSGRSSAPWIIGLNPAADACSLTSLSLNSLGHLDVKSTSKELGAALRENGSLVDLSDLSADCNDCLGHCSQRLDCLSTGTGTVLRGLLGHETLTSLSFRDHACREEGAAALAALLGASPILTSLDLSRSEIEDTGAVQLAALKRIASTRGASGTPRRGIRGGRWWAKTGSCSRTVRSSFRRMWCISRRTVASRLQDVVGKLWRRKHRGEEATHPAATDSRCRLLGAYPVAVGALVAGNCGRRRPLPALWHQV